MTLISSNVRLCEYSQGLPRNEVPNDSGVIEILDVQTFPSKFPTAKHTSLYSNTQSLVGFSVIPERVTLNDL